MEPSATQGGPRRGQSQDDRWPRALDPGYARVDDRSLFSLIDFACRFGSLINYYDSDNKVAGDWVEFFTRDPLITLASMASTDIDLAERRLSRLARRTRSERNSDRKHARLAELFDASLDLPRQVNRWLRGLSFPDLPATSVPWRTSIESAIRESLRERLQQLKSYAQGADAAFGRALDLDYSEFTSDWQLDRARPDASIFAGASDVERIDRAVPHVMTAWHVFPAAIAGWAADARPQLATAFERGGVHQPHIALFVAFARLFASAQASVNAFAARRTDFYFRRVLGERNRPAVPDRAYVAFTCAPGQEPVGVAIPARTPLSAGEDSAGRPIVFETHEDIRVTSAALARVCTIRVVSGPLVDSDPGHIVTERVLAHVVTPDRAAPGGWPTFGSDDDEPAGLGFSVSSPALALAGGTRSIAIEVRCAPSGEGPAAVLAHLAEATGVASTEVFNRLLEGAFTLSVSTASGWSPVASYAVDRPVERDGWAFRLAFSLGPDAPAVTCVPGSSVAPPAPTVRAELRQVRVSIAGPAGERFVYPLSVLEGLLVTAVIAHVDVAGLPGVRLANTDGDVDPSKPFAAFGAIPTAGSYLRIRHAELFSKSVSRLALAIRWFDLPAQFTGFRGYFRRYVVDVNGAAHPGLFDNQVFRVSVSVERPGSWAIAAPARQGGDYLFRTEDRPGPIPDPDGVLAKSTAIDDLVVRPAAARAPGYEPSDGSVRVELTAPGYGFGHSLYQPNMMHAVMANMSAGAACETTCREEYAALAEARRRLTDLLTEVERTWTLAKVLQWLSPLHWLTLVAQGLRAVYLWLTRALPAHAARRSDGTAESAAIVRVRYADSDFRPGRAGRLLVGRGYKHTVASRLNLTLRLLLDEAHASLADCLEEWQDRLPSREWQRLRSQLTDAKTARMPDELKALTTLHRQFEEASGSDEATADPSRQWLARSDAMLRAASWVLDCEVGIAGSTRMTYWSAVSANLTTCTNALQASHDRAVKRCVEACPQPRPMPNPPYVPQIETLTVGYSASAPATFSHLLPHGGHRLSSDLDADQVTLLPRFANAANLYLGFSQVTAPQTLHLYVRLGQHDQEHAQAFALTWDALAGNRWMRLASSLGTDATLGLQRSGIITLEVPGAPAAASTVLPGQYRWLRVSTANAAGVPNTIAIIPHAVMAARQLTPTGGTFERLLPAHAISDFVTPIAGIASVVQPAPSFGGRPPETDRAFQTRVVERLRHRDRAVTTWDYERLVLERFPAIWRVRAFPAHRLHAGEPGATGPGHVQVVVVPGPESPDVADPLAPLASADTLAEIEQMLTPLAGPFVRLQVVNPLYVRARVHATIRWRTGVDPRLAARRLNAALIECLSPWRRGEHEEMGARPEIAAFIQSRADVEALLAIDLACSPADAPSPSRRSVLVSAGEHDIRTFTTASAEVVGGY